MTRYRLKKDLPGCKAGVILNMHEVPGYGPHYYCDRDRETYKFDQEDMDDYRDWFEKVEEKSDEEFVLEWFRKNASCRPRDYMAGLLINYGLDVDRIRKEQS